MKAVIALAAAAIVGFVPRIVEAGCRGGGGGGGSGGGGGGGGHGQRWDAAASCADESDVVGFRRCTKFGAWGGNLQFPHLVFEAGVSVSRFGTLLDDQTGNVTHGSESFAYRVIKTGSRPRDTAVLSMLRAGFGLPHGLYTGLEVDLGGLVQSPPATTEMMSTGVFGTPDLQPRRGFLVDSFAVVGVRSSAGFGSVGIELAGGVRTVSYSFHSSYHDCEQSTSLTAVAPAAEARARGELWLSPWITAGVTVGTSVIERNSWMGGVYLGVHSRAFGGER